MFSSDSKIKIKFTTLDKVKVYLNIGETVQNNERVDREDKDLISLDQEYEIEYSSGLNFFITIRPLGENGGGKFSFDYWIQGTEEWTSNVYLIHAFSSGRLLSSIIIVMMIFLALSWVFFKCIKFYDRRQNKVEN